MRFLGEYYDCTTDLLRPDKHAEKCAKCRDGKPCPKASAGPALHGTDELRRDCYRRQKSAETDVASLGRTVSWHDFNGVDTEGCTTTRRGARAGRVPVSEAGDYENETPPEANPIVGAKRKKP